MLTATMTALSSVTTVAAIRNRLNKKITTCQRGCSWPNNDLDTNYSDGLETTLRRRDITIRCVRWHGSSSLNGVVLENKSGVTILRTIIYFTIHTTISDKFRNIKKYSNINLAFVSFNKLGRLTKVHKNCLPQSINHSVITEHHNHKFVLTNIKILDMERFLSKRL
ncbi:hypothetical protein ALC57_10743 [Trachymyrmex cornetzi]|uniref:Uncharacterized protein n=1 Tax=Trachymyrmex cornetzi TaxID=471704 RepID=A0A151J3G7_9HYME|nr:hypothetical protein ALC57_10743 [Trachymyrmex cornetzi]